MKCATCSRLDLEKYPVHATRGLGRCKEEEQLGKFVTMTYERDCEQYRKASETVIQQRREAWIKNKK